MPAIDLSGKTRRSLVLGSTRATAYDWLELFTSDGWRELAARGWRIGIDPMVGLTIHEVRDFFPAIEGEAISAKGLSGRPVGRRWAGGFHVREWNRAGCRFGGGVVR